MFTYARTHFVSTTPQQCIAPKWGAGVDAARPRQSKHRPSERHLAFYGAAKLCKRDARGAHVAGHFQSCIGKTYDTYECTCKAYVLVLGGITYSVPY